MRQISQLLKSILQGCVQLEVKSQIKKKFLELRENKFSSHLISIRIFSLLLIFSRRILLSFVHLFNVCENIRKYEYVSPHFLHKDSITYVLLCTLLLSFLVMLQELHSKQRSTNFHRLCLSFNVV